jgi:hypothetical protein
MKAIMSSLSERRLSVLIVNHTFSQMGPGRCGGNEKIFVNCSNSGATERERKCGVQIPVRRAEALSWKG